MSALPPINVRLHSGIEVSIRAAELRDASGIAALISAVYENGEGTVSEANEFQWPLQSIQQSVEEHGSATNCLMLVAVIDSAVIGLLKFEAGAGRRVAHQGRFGLWVHPSKRSGGVGRALLSTLIGWARTTGIECIRLTVLSDATRAINLYRSIGFEIEGTCRREVKYAPESYADQIHMAPFL